VGRLTNQEDIDNGVENLHCGEVDARERDEDCLCGEVDVRHGQKDGLID
jgi:hypothetical protein